MVLANGVAVAAAEVVEVVDSEEEDEGETVDLNAVPSWDVVLVLVVGGVAVVRLAVVVRLDVVEGIVARMLEDLLLFSSRKKDKDEREQL
ncbi:hypothetical protein HK101_011749, partial [Irineochytrium annulatum]